MKFGLALVFAVAVWDVRADIKECPHLDCAKEGPKCVAVQVPDSACKRCSCNGTESKNPDSSKEPNHEVASDSAGKDEGNKRTANAGAPGADAEKEHPKSKEKSLSKPESESHSSGGTSGNNGDGTEVSPCADCPEGCMVTMFRGKCTGCVSIEDPNTECH